jgi:hypothetical protein
MTALVVVMPLTQTICGSLRKLASLGSSLRYRKRCRTAQTQDHGYDTKHAMLLVCQMQMGLEILQTGELHVYRPGAAELSAIRDGACSHDELMNTATELQARMGGAEVTSGLPGDVDYAGIDPMVFESIKDGQ